jgi:hypothetical protein
MQSDIISNKLLVKPVKAVFQKPLTELDKIKLLKEIKEDVRKVKNSALIKKAYNT